MQLNVQSILAYCTPIALIQLGTFIRIRSFIAQKDYEALNTLLLTFNENKHFTGFGEHVQCIKSPFQASEGPSQARQGLSKT